MPSSRHGHFLFVNISFCVMIVGAFFLKYSSQPVLQLRLTSSSTCASLTDSNNDKDLVEEINLSSNSLIVCRWATVRPGKIRSYTNSTMNSRCDHFFRTPPPQPVSSVFVLFLLLFLVHQFVHFECVDTGHSNPPDEKRPPVTGPCTHPSILERCMS